jgi:uncharacterized pyridoxal phosphate-dependent enzyme
MSPSTSTTANMPVPTFDSLGVRTLINCMGTYTIISGSRVLEQVADAMVEATNHYVHMDELMEKVGERLAELTGAEWGYITSGCAAALSQVTAACIAGADPERMVRLPDAAGMRNEVIIQKTHRNSYDYAMRMTGANMIEVVTLADLRAAISDRTAMIAITGSAEERSAIPLKDVLEIGRAHGIPTFVDAAAERPDIPNRYLEMGADVVAYSGGKCLRGPQASGLVLGKKEILQAAFLNGAPHHALGRPMKAGKEEIMGLLAAVEAFVAGRDHDAEWRMWEGYLEEIRAAVADLPSVSTRIDQPGLSNVAPTLFITWDEDALHCTPQQIHDELFEGDPPIKTHARGGGLRIMPYMMEKGDAEIAASRLREVLSNRTEAQVAPDKAIPLADVAGTWEIHTEYTLGESTHSVVLEQEGSDLKGSYRSQFSWTEVEGHVCGDQVEFHTVLGLQSNRVRYVYTGRVEGACMSGTVDLDEFGSATWTACKIG